MIKVTHKNRIKMEVVIKINQMKHVGGLGEPIPR